jgi:hypothetical protein
LNKPSGGGWNPCGTHHPSHGLPPWHSPQPRRGVLHRCSYVVHLSHHAQLPVAAVSTASRGLSTAEPNACARTKRPVSLPLRMALTIDRLLTTGRRQDSKPRLCQFHRLYESPRLIDGLLKLFLRNGISNNPTAGLNVRLPILNHQGANSDAAIQVT